MITDWMSVSGWKQTYDSIVDVVICVNVVVRVRIIQYLIPLKYHHSTSLVTRR